MKNTLPDLIAQSERDIDAYWNEHDGDHFYKDELKELSRDSLTQAYTAALDMVEEMLKEAEKCKDCHGNGWIDCPQKVCEPQEHLCTMCGGAGECEMLYGPDLRATIQKAKELLGKQ